MATDRYSFSLTTFSPSGKLVQIEYALNAVMQGHTSVGIKTIHGIVLATEKKCPSILVEPESMSKISLISPGLGLVYSGMGPDARVLVAKAKKAAQTHWLAYREWPSALILVKELASIMQEFTQSGGVRPFGVSLLLAGYDDDQILGLYQIDPSGSFWQWKASAIGKNTISAKSFLEKRYQEEMSLDDAIHTAILTLKEGFEGSLASSTIEIGILSLLPPSRSKTYSTIPEWKNRDLVPEFRILSESEISEYLENL